MSRDDIPVRQPFDDFLRSKSKNGDSGNYRSNLESVVGDFLDWLEADAIAGTTFGELDTQVFRRYARDLSTPGADDDTKPVRSTVLANSTVLTYYAQVSAYIGWCVREGYLTSNYAKASESEEPLPDNDGRRSGDQQAWGKEERQLILRHVDEVAHKAIDEKASKAVKEVRDRAAVYLLAYTAVRGAEVFRDPEDDRRDGLLWGDIDLEHQSMTVLSKKKSEAWSDRSVLPQAVAPLERLEHVLDPASDEWPVFPSLHLPSLYARVRNVLDERGVPKDEVEAELDDVTGLFEVLDLMRDRDVSPPSISTDGVRSVLKRICDDAGLDVDDDHGYLVPHGARRGAGEVMVREKGFPEAARLLDNSERIVRSHYSHIEAAEMAESAGNAFDKHDR